MSCMDARPDSALALLETLADSMSNAPQETQMYYRLLTIKAEDKLYMPHTTDSVILSIVDYYRKRVIRNACLNPIIIWEEPIGT